MTEKQIWAVISAYASPPELVDRVQRLLKQVHRVVVVDDGSPGGNPVFERLPQAQVDLIQLPENAGIAAALNAGIETALASGADAVVTFDQDSDPPESFVAALRDTWVEAQIAGHEVGAVVPEFFADVRQVGGALPDGRLTGSRIIQSGMLIPRESIETVGLLRADFFIDLVDTEYEYRLRAAKRPIVVAVASSLPHSLGKRYKGSVLNKAMSVFGLHSDVTLSTPFRYYYRIRNRIVLNQLYPLYRSRIDTGLGYLHFLNALMLARPRRAFWHLLASGRAAAKNQQMGKMPPELQTLAGTITWNADALDE